jgi:uncharacterized protein YggT (Ycf19 family)
MHAAASTMASSRLPRGCRAFASLPARAAIAHGPRRLATARAADCGREEAPAQPSTSGQQAGGRRPLAPAALAGLALVAAAAWPEVAGAAAAPAGDFIDPATAHALEVLLRPIFSVFSLLYIVRIPMTWYPEIKPNDLPWVLAYLPTEPVLVATRKVIPLVGGVDVTPIVWVAMLSFLNEILLGPQGLLQLAQR